jgi:CheY-like chemotaxis protein
MSIDGPVIFIEDDQDDQELYTEILRELGITNVVKCFPHGKAALEYLQETKEHPFIIFCDINMPVMDGMHFRREVCASDHLKQKSIPFIYLTTAVHNLAVQTAYDLHVQGFFKKPQEYEVIKSLLKKIIDYWMYCEHPTPHQ